jgi:peptidoglycan/LPS O-acetylase OafA/YrhL
MRHVTRINAIEWLRGAAAVGIVLIHWIEISPKYGAAAVPPPMALRSGLDVFFVISGFVMYYTTRTTPSSGEATARFWWRRLLRIAPPYWFLSAIVVTAAVLGTGLTEYPFSAAHAVRSFAFVPATDLHGHVQPPLRVGWSLPGRAGRRRAGDRGDRDRRARRPRHAADREVRDPGSRARRSARARGARASRTRSTSHTC